MAKVLSELEMDVVMGRIKDPKVMAEAIRKLNDFQESKIEKEQVAAVNSFIPEANQYALDKISKSNGDPFSEQDRVNFSSLFHQKMNQLTRGAGIRI